MLLQYIEYQFVMRVLYDSMTWSGKKEQFSCVPIATLHSLLKRSPQLRQRDFSLFTFHSSLFTFHLKKSLINE